MYSECWIRSDTINADAVDMMISGDYATLFDAIHDLAYSTEYASWRIMKRRSLPQVVRRSQEPQTDVESQAFRYEIQPPRSRVNTS